MQTEASREAAKNQELWTSFKPSKRRTKKWLIGNVLSAYSFAVFAASRAFSFISN